MYTSDIRETDPEGRPVAVSPAPLARVREADDALRAWLSNGLELDYEGRWTFPAPDSASLTLRVRVTDDEAHTASLPLGGPTDRFVERAVDAVLAGAQRAIGGRVKRHMRDLLVATGE